MNTMKISPKTGKKFALASMMLVALLSLPVLTGCDSGGAGSDALAKANHFSTSGTRVVAILEDGTVACAANGDYHNETFVNEWTDLKQISAAIDYTVGLKNDGTVVFTGLDSTGVQDCETWTDIEFIKAAENCVIGVKSDGSVVVAGSLPSNVDEAEFTGLTDVDYVYANADKIIVLKNDGTAVAFGGTHNDSNYDNFTDLIDVAGDNMSFYGLKSDGTVVYSDDIFGDNAALDDWTNVVQIASDTNGGLYGLTSDGTLLFLNVDDNIESVASGWADIVAISAGEDSLVGLKSDGSVVTALSGWYASSFDLDVTGWTIK